MFFRQLPWKSLTTFVLGLVIAHLAFSQSEIKKSLEMEKRYTALPQLFHRLKQTPELVFLGDSRVIHGIAPSMIEKLIAERTKKKIRVANLGMPGGPPMTHLAWIGHLLKKKKPPKWVIIHLSPYMFSSLIGKVLSRESIHSLFLASSIHRAWFAGMPAEDIFRVLTSNISSAYRFRRQYLKYLWAKKKRKKIPSYTWGDRGGKPLRGVKASDQRKYAYSRGRGYLREISKPKAQFHQEHWGYFLATIKQLRSASVKVAVVLSPVSLPLVRNHRKGTLFPEIYKKLRKSLKKRHIPFWDHRRADILRDEFFRDGDHLNSAGARLYSAWLTENFLLPRFFQVKKRNLRWTQKRPSRGCRILFDFEEKQNKAWTFQGSAFAIRAGGRGSQWPLQRIQGLQLLNSYHHQIGDRAVGIATSTSFEPKGKTLQFYIGGGRHRALQVELWVDGKKVRAATGRNSETLHRIVWKLGTIQGKKAYIRVVDQHKGRWGHLLLEQVEICQ